ncbi:hypothetical protein [Streptomyces sp. AS02]|uniref:hypothetical protein n=1 Tax=Streptomyces sp. AS02 TaxID=2938946 RepID=UPI00201FCF3D|nr:hypothetical protein [Streptomyces sp. AS02]MCL8014508.1 hypothetical protein [Streptomyces sp. AS02]
MSPRSEHHSDPDDPYGLDRILFPRSRWLTPDRGSRPRNAFNQLVAVAAVLGIGAGGWGLWLEAQEYQDRQASRERIAEACAGLVDPDRVLGLNGGTARARAGSGADDSFTLGSLPGAGGCTIYRVGRPGTSYGHFGLTVYTNPSDKYANLVGDEDPFDDRDEKRVDDVTRVADESPDYPLSLSQEDDGRLGSYNQDSATAKVTCKTGKTGVTSVNAMAAADYDDVSFQDRWTLIQVAVDAAYKAAKHVHCTPEGKDPASFARLYVPDAKLVKATSADGTCGWYAGFLNREGAGRLPDRALTAPIGAHSAAESCLLAASPGQVKRVWPELPRDDDERLSYVLSVSPWWLETRSFIGDEAHEVVAEYFGGDQIPLRPGTAGSRAGVWWAASTCAGRPALHTLSVPYSYEDVIKPRLRSLFKAYVDDIAARRHCTNIKFPAASTFTAN